MNEISVYCADLSVWSMKDCYAVLSGAERQRASIIFDPRARHEFVATRAILRLLLAKHTGSQAATLRLGTGEYGKPLLLDGGLCCLIAREYNARRPEEARCCEYLILSGG